WAAEAARAVCNQGSHATALLIAAIAPFAHRWKTSLAAAATMSAQRSPSLRRRMRTVGYHGESARFIIHRTAAGSFSSSQVGLALSPAKCPTPVSTLPAAP